MIYICLRGRMQQLQPIRLHRPRTGIKTSKTNLYHGSSNQLIRNCQIFRFPVLRCILIGYYFQRLLNKFNLDFSYMSLSIVSVNVCGGRHMYMHVQSGSRVSATLDIYISDDLWTSRNIYDMIYDLATACFRQFFSTVTHDH